MGKNVDKEGLGWTAGGIEQQNGAGQPCMWSPVTEKGATRTHAPTRGRKTAGERRRARCCLPARLPPACRSAPCASESVVSGRRRAARKVTDGDGDGEKEIRRRRVPGGEESDRNETRSLKK